MIVYRYIEKYIEGQQMAKKSKVGTTTKSDVITVRLSPKLKYGLELLARKQHRPLSSVVSRAIEQSINDPEAGLYKNTSKGLKIKEPKQMLDILWDVHPADRLVKLATHWPELMTYEEEKRVKAIKKLGWWPKKGDLATEALLDAWPNIHFDPGNEPWKSFD